MVKFVENELNTIKKEINEMWLLVHDQLENAYKAVLDIDVELAERVSTREKRVNAFELKIDSDIEDFIALYNPVAIDLRFAALAIMPTAWPVSCSAAPSPKRTRSFSSACASKR